jgi:hypothetical protein
VCSIRCSGSGLVIKGVDYFTIEECRKIPCALGDFLTSTLLGIYPQSEYEIIILMTNTLRVPSHEGNCYSATVRSLLSSAILRTMVTVRFAWRLPLCLGQVIALQILIWKLPSWTP